MAKVLKSLSRGMDTIKLWRCLRGIIDETDSPLDALALTEEALQRQPGLLRDNESAEEFEERVRKLLERAGLLKAAGTEDDRAPGAEVPLSLSIANAGRTPAPLTERRAAAIADSLMGKPAGPGTSQHFAMATPPSSAPNERRAEAIVDGLFGRPHPTAGRDARAAFDLEVAKSVAQPTPLSEKRAEEVADTILPRKGKTPFNPTPEQRVLMDKLRAALKAKKERGETNWHEAVAEMMAENRKNNADRIDEEPFLALLENMVAQHCQD